MLSSAVAKRVFPRGLLTFCLFGDVPSVMVITCNISVYKALFQNPTYMYSSGYSMGPNRKFCDCVSSSTSRSRW